MLLHKHSHYILDIDIKPGYFDRFNNLTGDGKSVFWEKVDQTLHKFDLQLDDVTLKPQPKKAKKSQSFKHAHFNQYRLPPPLVKHK